MKTTNLRCDYHINPLGIDLAAPRLSWELLDPRRGARQTAYQITVAGSARELGSKAGVLWDSGKVTSDQTAHVRYRGPKLTSRQRCYWRVRVWDATGKPSQWSKPAWWEMGLLDRSEWVGEWIGSFLVGAPRTSVPCPYLRKTFTLAKPVKAARLYVTALGIYEFYLNGQRVGNDVFRPGWTNYNKRVQYDVYDVAKLLKSKGNAAGAILGDGWYCGTLGWQGRQTYGDRPRLLAQLLVEFTDGATQIVATDAAWRTATGPLIESDPQTGESYDARQEMPGWATAKFDDADWTKVKVFPAPAIALVAKLGPPVRQMKELKPIAAPRRVGDSWVFDLGQNMVGWVRLKARGGAGGNIRLRHAEILDKDGTLYTTNLRLARATDYYTLKGGGWEIYEPRFTFHGFRYVEVNGLSEPPTRDTITGIVLHSDTPPTGEFACSDPLLNQLQHNIQWGQRGNFLEVPTDCPQRDERLGWTGDAQVFCRTAAFNMDVAAFFTKWQTDIDDAQLPDGRIPAVVPDPLWQLKDGGPAWSDAVIICPWTIYQCYGDAGLLAKHYDQMARFIEWLRRESRGLIRCYAGYKWEGHGDWLAQDGSGSLFGGTPKDLIGTAFFAYSTRLLSKIAGVLGKTDDAAKYEQLFQKIRKVFQQRFVAKSGLLAGQTQTSYVLALYFDLLPDELRAAAADALVLDIQRRGMHLSTGFVGTAYLPHVLTRAGKLDVAYELLLQKSWPSWLYAVTQGATTIWERWDGWTEDKGFANPSMNSFNHYAYGAIGDWLYSTVAGLDIDPAHPGYKHLLIQPRPGGKLTHARASLHTIHGLAESRWRIIGGKFHLAVTIPPNTTATIKLPGQKSQKVEAGQYQFTVSLPK